MMISQIVAYNDVLDDVIKSSKIEYCTTEFIWLGPSKQYHAVVSPNQAHFLEVLTPVGNIVYNQ